MKKSPGRPRGTLAGRFATKIEPGPIAPTMDTPCLLWTAATRFGYGRICGEGISSMKLAHVVAWEFVNGPVPEGHHIHHRCEIKHCVNEEHLEALASKKHLELHGKKH